MQPATLSTGVPSLDSIIERVLLGDNIVWLVSSPELYDYFASRFLERCVEGRAPVAYVHFAERVDYAALAGASQTEVLRLDPYEGAEALRRRLGEQIGRCEPGAHYLFDNLSRLCDVWEDEEALVEWFRAVCPLLYSREAVACFGLLMGAQSNSTVARIRDTTQILLESYEEAGRVYVRPLKVWDRYSERMFQPHVLAGEQLIPATALRAHPAQLPSAREADLLAEYQMRAQAQTSLSIREELIRTVISNRPEYIAVARDYFPVPDLVDLKSRIIGSGVIGGKAAGMLLSNRILRAVCERDGHAELLAQLREPESFFVGSSVYFNFLINNGLLGWLDLKHAEPERIAEAFPQLQREFQAGEFPRTIRRGLREVIEAFGGRPIIVRSSSLLEDSLNMAFAGKYESVFLGNQGTAAQCLEELLRAVRHVYASSLGPDALAYRKRNGLLEFQEHMAVLIQAVEGTAYRGLFFPPVAGVAFSRNPYPWSERIDTRAGLVRLVFGLGTRAVNRVESDYPRLVALSHPGLHPDGDYATSVRYRQKHMDAVDLEANRLQTLSIAEHVGPDHPMAYYAFSIFRDGLVRPPVARRIDARPEELAVTFQNLLERTDFVELARYVLTSVEECYRYPVDIEFTLDVEEGNRAVFCLLQCRPLTQRTEFTPAQIPADVPPERVLFLVRKAVPDGELHDLRYILLIDSRSYDAAADNRTRSRIARAVGAVNHLDAVARGGLALIGPGRWGSVNIELGVPVTYAEINNARLLMELARPRAGYSPEVSYGTHFFQDLVESRTFYLPLYPEDPACTYNEPFFDEAPNELARLVPQYGDLAPYVKVIDVPAASDGLYLQVAMNQPESVGLGYLAPPSRAGRAEAT